MPTALNIARSILGQPWRWRGTGADGRDPDFRPDDLVTQLLLARGCTREAMAAHREPTIRAFMPDPSLFPDIDKAAPPMADAVEARDGLTILGYYDDAGATKHRKKTGS